MIDETHNSADADSVIIKVNYAGVCGSDRGIWFRQAFGDHITQSLEKEQEKKYRIIGHEFFGQVVRVGSRVTHIKPDDFVACESHVVCNQCYQCNRGEKHVCTNEKILGISLDGGFAEYAKVPAHAVWITNVRHIRPEVAAVQEPFGNAVHAASKTDLKGKTIAIFGLGPIGLFLTLIARGLGASRIIGVDPNPVAREMAKKLGIDEAISVASDDSASPWRHNPAVAQTIMKMTNGVGADVSFEMAGVNSSVNNALYSTRRGGDIILFGIKQGDFVFEDYNRLIVRGITMHAVIGRRIWETWEITRGLLEDSSNHIQEKIFDVILKQGNGTILPIADYTKEVFEKKMLEHPKILLKF